jgi:hypothetical protein
LLVSVDDVADIVHEERRINESRELISLMITREAV